MYIKWKREVTLLYWYRQPERVADPLQNTAGTFFPTILRIFPRPSQCQNA
jgi:hypothetical protein